MNKQPTKLLPPSPAVQDGQKAELMAMMQAMPKPTAAQVQADIQAAADGTYVRTDQARQDEGSHERF